jgi:hypothetical protein
LSGSPERNPPNIEGLSVETNEPMTRRLISKRLVGKVGAFRQVDGDILAQTMHNIDAPAGYVGD